MIGKPVGFFAHIPADSGLHLLPIPFSKTFADHYTLGEFSNEEYPTLVPPGGKIDTIAVPAVLAAFNWPKGTERYRRVQRFTETLFTKWDKFKEPYRHPKWRDVNLAAIVPGWTRWSVAEEMLTRLRQQDQRVAEFGSFMNLESPALRDLSPEERKALFEEFLKWQKQGRTIERQGSSGEPRGSSVQPRRSAAATKRRETAAWWRATAAKRRAATWNWRKAARKQRKAETEHCGARQQSPALTAQALRGRRCAPKIRFG